MASINPFTCPVCGESAFSRTPRGFAGSADTPHQFLTCHQCKKVIFEIVSTSQREIRLYRYEPGGLMTRDGIMYQITRILKVGFDEFLLYLTVVSVDHLLGDPKSGR